MKGLNFGSWIPHLFYDLIGRITPGAVILLIVLFPLVYYPYGFTSEFSFWALQILLFVIVFASVALRRHLEVRSRNLMVSNYSMVWENSKKEIENKTKV